MTQIEKIKNFNNLYKRPEEENTIISLEEEPNLLYNTDATDGYLGWWFEGQAKRVEHPFTLQIKDGTTEGRNKYTFNGETAKSLNIKAYDSNTVLTTSADGELIIQSKNTNNQVKYYNTASAVNYPVLLSWYDTSTTADKTYYARYTPKVFCKPSDGSLTSSGTITAKNGFVGNLNGIASKACAAQQGTPSKPIYWTSNGTPLACNNTLDVSITGSACSLDTTNTTENSIYTWMKATSTNLYVQCSAASDNGGAIITTLINCTSQANGAPVFNGNYTQTFNTTLMEVCGFQLGSTVITGWYAKATKIFIDIEEGSTGNVIWIPLFQDNNMIQHQYRQIVINNLSSVNIILRFQNMSNGTRVLRTTGHKQTLTTSSPTYEITLYAKQAHIFNAFYVWDTAQSRTNTFCFVSDY